MDTVAPSERGALTTVSDVNTDISAGTQPLPVARQRNNTPPTIPEAANIYNSLPILSAESAIAPSLCSPISRRTAPEG